MDFAALINLYFERSGALQSYWTLYVVIVGGLLAFSSLRKEPDLVTTALVAVLFSFFAYKNLGAIVEVTEQKFYPGRSKSGSRCFGRPICWVSGSSTSRL